MNEDRLDQATDRDAKNLTYDLGAATTSDLSFENGSMLGPDMLVRKGSGSGLAADTGAKWSPRIADWSGHDATLLGARRMRSINVQSGVVRVLDQHLVRYRFTVSRHRIAVRLATDF